ncbi:methionine ABC transporter substrate-binding protein [Comamonas serinivorans]|uniref:Lipoprotein n=1 Tax=Comamonas serinivorans TaxID=1082851 RepID=A0A1Y0ERE8_9BURK|nr:MetQ/NlpA family ABC transporter substrate-binding protein [Comamonas serinivorans]ARU06078.1 methionine ABC transporter substrate-binding protein [Comamonas serinivorans]
MFKTTRRLTLTAVAALTLWGTAGLAQAQEVLKVGATAVPHAELLNHVKPKLKAEGVDLQVVEFSDYVQPNLAVSDKQLDANFFQHKPYLDSFNKERKTTLTVVPNGGVHVEPFGAYSSKLKSLKDLKNGATVAIPNDATNGGRALLLLQKQGLIELKDKASLSATPLDIKSNPKKLKFRELEAAQLPRSLPDVDIALINTNYALQANLNPLKDALALESKESPYVNVVVSRADNAKSPAIAKLMAALRSADTKQFILDKYKGAVVPAF